MILPTFFLFIVPEGKKTKSVKDTKKEVKEAWSFMDKN